MIQYILVLKSYLGCTQLSRSTGIVGVGELAHQATISMDTLYISRVPRKEVVRYTALQ